MKDKIKLPWWYYILMIIVFIFIICLIAYNPTKNSQYFYKNRINATIKKIKFYSADESQANAYHYFYNNKFYLASYDIQDTLIIGDSIVKEKENDFSFKVFRKGKMLFEHIDTTHPGIMYNCYKLFLPNFGDK